MNATQAELARLIDTFSKGEGKNLSPVPGVHCIKISGKTNPTKGHWQAVLGIIAQGKKEIALGTDIFTIDHSDYVATPLDLPVISRIVEASAEKPFFGLLIELDHLMLSEVAAQLEQESYLKESGEPRSVFVGRANEKMLEASLRLARLFHEPGDIKVLGKLIIKEIMYHLLKSDDGPALQQFVRSGSKMHKISKSIHTLNSGLSEEIDVVALARAANMSRSAFFKHFKEVTAVSPIQYQKRLRLIEARRLMLDENESAERSAFRVGYKSPSQFSREYSRMFGSSPIRHSDGLKKSMA